MRIHVLPLVDPDTLWAPDIGSQTRFHDPPRERNLTPMIKGMWLCPWSLLSEGDAYHRLERRPLSSFPYGIPAPLSLFDMESAPATSDSMWQWVEQQEASGDLRGHPIAPSVGNDPSPAPISKHPRDNSLVKALPCSINQTLWLQVAGVTEFPVDKTLHALCSARYRGPEPPWMAEVRRHQRPSHMYALLCAHGHLPLCTGLLAGDWDAHMEAQGLSLESCVLHWLALATGCSWSRDDGVESDDIVSIDLSDSERLVLVQRRPTPLSWMERRHRSFVPVLDIEVEGVAGGGVAGGGVAGGGVVKDGHVVPPQTREEPDPSEEKGAEDDDGDHDPPPRPLMPPTIHSVVTINGVTHWFSNLDERLRTLGALQRVVRVRVSNHHQG
jgi:hypothetical protein